MFHLRVSAEQPGMTIATVGKQMDLGIKIPNNISEHISYEVTSIEVRLGVDATIKNASSGQKRFGAMADALIDTTTGKQR